MTELTQTYAAPTNFLARFTAKWAALAEKFAQYKTYRQSLAELSQLSDRDLEDIGLTRGGLRARLRETIFNG